MTDKCLEQALKYARDQKWAVIPLYSISAEGICTCYKGNKCQSPGKHPRVGRGFKQASKDLQVITEWWKDWPNSNIGIVTGKVSGIVVLDVDLKNDGLKSFAYLQKKIILPETLKSLTGGGGFHLFFKHPGIKVRNKTSFLPGLDIRGDGGYIVAPPSNHISGKHYKWEDSNENA